MHDGIDAKYERFLRLYQANQDRIFRFIVTLLPNYTAAEDVMQDTMLVMWRKFDQFEVGTNFSAWGMQIARFNISKYCRSATSGMVRFDDEAIRRILVDHARLEPTDDCYLEALEGCLKRLQAGSREILSLRYTEGMKITEIAHKIGKPLQSVYKSFSRIHHALYECIKRSVRAEGGSL